MLRSDLGTTAPRPQAFRHQFVAPPSPPRLEVGLGNHATAVGPAPARSKLVERSWVLLESVVRDGRATYVPARQPEIVSNNELLKRATQSTARIYAFFDHIIEQNALFDSICGGGAAAERVQVRAHTQEEAWHALGGTPGLLVDIGAVKPLIGSAFAKSQVRDMEKNGFKAVYRELAAPQYMRGVGKGSQCVRGQLVSSELYMMAASSNTLDLCLRMIPVIRRLHLLPPLYGLDELININSWFAQRLGL